MKKNVKLILAAVALILVAGIMVGVYFATRPQPEKGDKKITVTVVHKDGSEKPFVCYTDEEYLAPVLVAEGIVEDNPTEYGLYILTADGEYADYNADGGWWRVLDGETPADSGASAVVIRDGGSYKLVYTVGWG